MIHDLWSQESKRSLRHFFVQTQVTQKVSNRIIFLMEGSEESNRPIEEQAFIVICNFS